MPYSNNYPCQVEGCHRAKRYKMYCPTHHVRWKKWGDPLGNAPHGNNLKHTHCTIEGCDKAHQAQGMCQMHYRRNALYGDPNKADGKLRSGKARVNQNGYIEIYNPEHPNSNTSGHILEHRLIMAEYLGRDLQPDENVHHKNGNRSDNRIENLELWSKGQPAGQRVEDKVAHAIEILKQYAPDKLVGESVA